MSIAQALYDDAKLLPSRYTFSIIRFLEKMATFASESTRGVYSFAGLCPISIMLAKKLFVTLTTSSH